MYFGERLINLKKEMEVCKMTDPNKLEDFGNKMKDASEKMKDTGKKMQKMGCLFTVLLTIPIALTIFLGIPGMVIGGIIFFVGLVSAFKSKK